MANEDTTSEKKYSLISHQSKPTFELSKIWVKAECAPDPSRAINDFLCMLPYDDHVSSNILSKVEEICCNKIRLSSELIETVLTTLFDGSNCIFTTCKGKISKEAKPGRKPIISISIPTFKCVMCSTSVLATKLIQRVPKAMIRELLPRFGPNLLNEFFNIANCGIEYKPFVSAQSKIANSAKISKQSPLSQSLFETPITKSSPIISKFETTNPFLNSQGEDINDPKPNDKIMSLENENNALRAELEIMKVKLASSTSKFANVDSDRNESIAGNSDLSIEPKDASIETLIENQSKLTTSEMIKQLISICIGFKQENNLMKVKIEELSKKVEFKESASQELPYLEAIKKGIDNPNNKRPLSRVDVKNLNANSFNQIEAKEYSTIHFQGLKSSAGVKPIKNFMKEIGIDIRKILLIWFISRDILEITVYSEYVDELSHLMQEVQKNPKFKEVIIKRIKFEALDQTNIRNPNCQSHAKDIFVNRMKKKISFIEKMIPTIPQWRRLRNYVELQLKTESFDVHIKKSNIERSCDINLTGLIEKKIDELLIPKNDRQNVASTVDNDSGTIDNNSENIVENLSSQKISEEQLIIQGESLSQ